MGIASSGRVSINEIATEYGGAPPHYISEYYGKGGVTGSGLIRVSDFHGTSARELPTKLWGYITSEESSAVFDWYSNIPQQYGNINDTCDIDCNFSSQTGLNRIYYYHSCKDTHQIWAIDLNNNGSVNFWRVSITAKDLHHNSSTFPFTAAIHS